MLQPRWNWKQIEQAAMDQPLDYFGPAPMSGESTENGLKFARAKLIDNIRRKLVQISEQAQEES